jgi:hypothetical protein
MPMDGRMDNIYKERKLLMQAKHNSNRYDDGASGNDDF